MTRPVHILQVTKSTAGVAEYVRWLVEGLDPDRFKLTVICLSENSRQFADELRDKNHVSAYDLEMNRFSIDPVSDLRVMFQIRRILRSGQYDLVHAHASKPGFLARMAAVGSGLPVIYSPHCFSFHAGTGAFQAALFAWLERFAARFLTTKIMVVADGEKTLAQRYHVGDPGQFITVHHGIELKDLQREKPGIRFKQQLGLADECFLVGAVGRLNAQKAPFDFIRMAADVKRRIPKAHFVWVGSGPLEGAARALCQELGLQDHFHFAGQRADVNALLSSLDCFVLPSLWEGFSIVLLEAMAAQLPIVATNIPGNDEALRDGVDGWLVPPGDIGAMAEKVARLLEDPGLAGKFGTSSLERVRQNFDRRLMLENVQKMYTATAHV